MTYRYTKGEERWKIDPLKFDQLNRWQLYHAVNEAWSRLRIYPSCADAMTAVAQGNTGVTGWDATPHDPAAFAQEQWSAEAW